MSRSLIGPVPRFAPPSEFARDVNRRVRDALAKIGDGRFGDGSLWLRVAVIVGAGLATYAMVLIGLARGWAAGACIVVSAFATFMLMLLLGHDASHGSVSARGWINRLVLFVTFAILGVDGGLWRDRHVRLHHTAVNLPNTGIDSDSVLMLRLAPYKPWRWWQRFQPIYGLALYALGHAGLVWIEDIQDLFAKRAEGRREFFTPSALARFAGGKAIHAALFIGLPRLILNPAIHVLVFGYMLASAIIAACFAVVVIGTHVSDLAEFPKPDAEGLLPHDWATHQVVTSVDWSPTSVMAALWSGGANAHVAHHLFPGYHHRHAALLSRIIAETAHEHGLPLHITTFWGLVMGHWRHLVALSRPQQTAHA